MTPIEMATDLMSKLRQNLNGNMNIKNEDAVLTAIDSCIALTKSLLPVEQQFNCELMEWVGEKQYLKLDSKDKWATENGKQYTTELLQLFTQQKDKDGK